MHSYDGFISEAAEFSRQALVIAIVTIGSAMLIALSSSSIGDQSWGEMLAELAMWGAI